MNEKFNKNKNSNYWNKTNNEKWRSSEKDEEKRSSNNMAMSGIDDEMIFIANDVRKFEKIFGLPIRVSPCTCAMILD